MKLWLKIVLGIAAIAFLGGLLVYHFVYNKPHKDFERATPDYSLTALQLYDSFMSDVAGAEQKYNGKVLQITGAVDMVEQASDMAIVVFVFSDGLFGEEGVRCTMLENHEAHALELQPGDKVTLKGLCTGFTGSDVILEHCSFIR